MCLVDAIVRKIVLFQISQILDYKAASMVNRALYIQDTLGTVYTVYSTHCIQHTLFTVQCIQCTVQSAPQLDPGPCEQSVLNTVTRARYQMGQEANDYSAVNLSMTHPSFCCLRSLGERDKCLLDFLLPLLLLLLLFGGQRGWLYDVPGQTVNPNVRAEARPVISPEKDSGVWQINILSYCESAAATACA